MNLSGIIAHHADRFSDHIAVSTTEEQITYAELYARSQRCAGALRELGASQGDVIGVLLHNCVDYLELLIGAAHIGAVFMPLNWRLSGPELTYIASHAEARLLISEPELRAQFDDLQAQGPGRVYATLGAQDGVWQSLDAARQAAEPVTDPVHVAGDELMRLMYTSGTTSRPKGVMISYANLYWKCASHAVELGFTDRDIALACGPLYHVGTLDIMATNMLYVGGCTHIVRRFAVDAVFEAIERQRCSVGWLAPAMINAVMADESVGQRDLGSVRLIVAGGEKMPLPLINRVAAAFPNAWFADAYGLTETVSGDTYLDPRRTIEKLGSVGKAVLHTEIQIVDAEDRPVPNNEVGEITIRGPKLFLGYWKDEEATSWAYRNGWFHTGDLGRFDDEGYLYIVDRLKDMIISGGENIASSEVERVVYEHDAVLEVAVVGSPNERWGEVPVAYVVLRQGSAVEEDELDAHCRERLAKYKTPKGFRFVDELPRNPSGKVLKRVLRDQETDDTGVAG